MQSFEDVGALKGVLITRAEPGATQTSNRLIEIGLQPILAPIFETHSALIDVPESNRIAATLVTSGNAIAAIPACLRCKPTFTVGDATASAAVNAGFGDVVSAHGNAHDLAELVANKLNPASGTLFLPTTKGQGIHLATALRKDGFHVLRRIAYRVERLPEFPVHAARSLRSGHIDAALFFSADSAHHFVRLMRAAGLLETLRNVEAVAISQRSIVPLRRLPWRRISVADQPNQDAMLNLLK
jgi:uroporphyrinogen-III synthase